MRTEKMKVVCLLLAFAMPVGCGQSTVTSGAKELAEYNYVVGHLYGINRAKLFGFCRQIEDNEDASNMYLWMLNEIRGLKDKHFEHEAKVHEKNTNEPFDIWHRKGVKDYWGEVWTNGDVMRFAIFKNQPNGPGEVIPGSNTTMELHRRLEQWRNENGY